MNHWRGIGHLTSDPRFLETHDPSAVCVLRIAVKRAGPLGQDGYFDVQCRGDQGVLCARHLKAGQRVSIYGRLIFDELRSHHGTYASRICIVAEHVELLPSPNDSLTR
jgi:single-stranded DNA-binding protein